MPERYYQRESPSFRVRHTRKMYLKITGNYEYAGNIYRDVDDSNVFDDDFRLPTSKNPYVFFSSILVTYLKTLEDCNLLRCNDRTFCHFSHRQ